MGRTLAIHWAATTHGTWLHGDPRGSWYNGRVIGPDPYLEAATRASLSDDAILLNDIERELVADEFGKIIREHPHQILAATIQPTHLHLIFAPLKEEVKTVIARFKYRSAVVVLASRRESAPYSGAVAARRKSSLWTASQFPVFIFNELHLVNAIEYVRDHNRRIGLPPDPYDWIEPLFPAGDLTGERMTRNATCEVPPTT